MQLSPGTHRSSAVSGSSSKLVARVLGPEHSSHEANSRVIVADAVVLAKVSRVAATRVEAATRLGERVVDLAVLRGVE